MSVLHVLQHVAPLSPMLLMPQFFLFLADLAAYYGGVVAVAIEVGEAIAINFAISRITRALAGKPSAGSVPNSQQVTVHSTVAARQIIYGSPRVSGVVVYYGTTGASSEFLWFVIVVAGHQVDSMTDIWLDGDLITDAQIDGTGKVTAGKYSGKLRVYRHLGTDAQTAEANLTAADAVWTSAHRLRGCAYFALRLERDQTVYASGVPTNFFAQVSGKRVYDPRLDSTNGGSGSQRLNDATTWAFSQNSILCAVDYVTGGSMVFDVTTPKFPRYCGMGEATTRINWANVAAGANKCDEAVNIPGSTTQLRYVTVGVLSLGDAHSTNLGRLMAACAGQLVYSGGQYRFFPGEYDAPTITITDSDLVGKGYELAGGTPRNQLYNAVVGLYIDPNRNYSSVSSAIRTDSTYETEDGEQIVKTLDLSMVSNEYRAQRICEISKQESRMQEVITLYLAASGFKIGMWETINLTIAELGYANKIHRVMNWELNPDTTEVTLTAKEELSAVYTDPNPSTGYGALAITSSITQNESPSVPLSCKVIPQLDGVEFFIPRPLYVAQGTRYQVWEFSSSTPFSSAVLLAESEANDIFIPKYDTTARFYWVQLTKGGFLSGPFPDAGSPGMSGAALAITAGFRCILDTYSTGKAGNPGPLVTPTVTAIGVAGVPPYTYAWTDLGVGTITIDSPATAATTFRRTTLGSPFSWRETMRCTVTDSTAATRTADCVVAMFDVTAL